MPWLIAGFLTALCLVPLDSVKLSVSLPFDPTFDRILLIGVGLIWVLSLAAAGDARPRIPRLGVVGYALWFWVLSAFISIMVSLPNLVLEAEFELALKKVLLLLTYVGFFFMVVSVVKPGEIQAFVTLWIGLSCVLAIGAIWQRQTGTNVFQQWTAAVLPGIFDVTQTPSARGGGPVAVIGPTAHGLALTTMLVLPLPFVVQRLLEIEDWRADLRRAAPLVLAVLLLTAGSIVTARKSAIVVPIVGLAVMALYRPQQMRRLVPLGVVAVVFIQGVAPGALNSIKTRAFGGDPYSEQSTKDRTADYDAVVPDLLANPLFGKGYGTYDPYIYRILDNQWLLTTIESGLFGVLGLLGFVVAGWYVPHRLVRRQKTERAPPAMAAAAACVAFGVAAALYDALSFVQSMYLLFFVVAVSVITAAAADATFEESASHVPLPDRPEDAMRTIDGAEMSR